MTAKCPSCWRTGRPCSPIGPTECRCAMSTFSATPGETCGGRQIEGRDRVQQRRQRRDAEGWQRENSTDFAELRRPSESDRAVFRPGLRRVAAIRDADAPADDDTQSAGRANACGPAAVGSPNRPSRGLRGDVRAICGQRRARGDAGRRLREGLARVAPLFQMVLEEAGQGRFPILADAVKTVSF